ncbi:CDGSH iron-sulfur domain-containing protein [Roseomonas sp. CAU 1739]|uniref:CDGSH iron-sulfur domain-containing protein n=1 Tax=Roseomonas sp. CAU 1739 TaxID=3140364 RepID=UPI00325BF896
MATEHATARLHKDGPLELRGDLHLAGSAVGAEAWLCRCGHSKTKPWCDESHNTAACSLTGDGPHRDGVALPDAPAAIDLAPQPNGPVKVTGPLVMLNEAGEVTDRTMQVFLCRCGKSAKQPYCDGTHRRAGFIAP